MSRLDEREAAVDRRLRYQREELVRCLDWQRERKSAQAAYELQEKAIPRLQLEGLGFFDRRRTKKAATAEWFRRMHEYSDRLDEIDSRYPFSKFSLEDLTTDIAKLTKQAERIQSEIEKRARKQAKSARVAAVLSKSRNVAMSVKGSLPLDHIYPLSKGGLSTPENMVYVCSECNARKRDHTLREFLKFTGFPREKVEGRLEQLGKDF